MPLDSQEFSIRCRSTLSVATGAFTSSAPVDLSRVVNLLSGIAASQADVPLYQVLTIATGATATVDLAGAATGMLGAIVTMVKLKTFAVISDPANTTAITVSRPAANGVALFGAASGSLAPIEPGGFFAWASPGAAGAAVVAATGDLISITNAAGASATVHVYGTGTSA